MNPKHPTPTNEPLSTPEPSPSSKNPKIKANGKSLADAVKSESPTKETAPILKRVVPQALTYTGWYQNIINAMCTVFSGNPSFILNLGSGNRPSIEKILDAQNKQIMEIVNADYITFKRTPAEFNNATNILEYLESCQDDLFSSIISCRYFEHIPWGELDYYLYQMYRVLTPGGTLTFVVPDFSKLGKALNQLDSKFDYQRWFTLNSEFFNEKNDPHSCLWTSKIAEKLLTGEGFFNDINVNPITIDGRHWYIEINAKKKPECLFKK